MLPPTTERGLLGHFLHGVYPPAVYQHASPSPVRSPTSSSLREISEARAGGGGVRGGAGGSKIPRNGGGGGRGAGGRSRDVRGTTHVTTGAERGTMEATKTTATAESGRRRTTEDPSVSRIENGAGATRRSSDLVSSKEGKYRMGGKGTEESTDESSKWSVEETEDSASKDEAKDSTLPVRLPTSLSLRAILAARARGGGVRGGAGGSRIPRNGGGGGRGAGWRGSRVEIQGRTGSPYIR